MLPSPTTIVALSYRTRGDYDLAIEDCSRAIKLKPRSMLKPYYNRGAAYRSKGAIMTLPSEDYNKVDRAESEFCPSLLQPWCAYYKKSEVGLVLLKTMTRAIELKPELCKCL